MAAKPRAPRDARESRLADYLRQITARLRAQLEDSLVGAWVIGSTALGDFDPERSDVDVQAVARCRLGRPALERLAAELSHDALPCPVRGLEFVLYARDDLPDPDGPAFQLNLNTGPRMRQHEGFDPRAEPRFWFTLDVAIARERARPLSGPCPAVMLPPLPHQLILQALMAALDWYRVNDPAQAILAGCRAWAWAADGRWLSKGEAAAWATARLADPDAVTRALEHRAHPRQPGPTASEADAFVELVQALLRRDA